jgi:hypothetical protein
MFRNACVLLIALFSLAAVPLRLSSQAAAAPPANASADEVVMARLVALRDAFISQIKAEGFQPSLARLKSFSIIHLLLEGMKMTRTFCISQHGQP